MSGLKAVDKKEVDVALEVQHFPKDPCGHRNVLYLNRISVSIVAAMLSVIFQEANTGRNRVRDTEDLSLFFFLQHHVSL